MIDVYMIGAVLGGLLIAAIFCRIADWRGWFDE